MISFDSSYDFVITVETFDKDNDNENPAADENVETIPEINEAVDEEGSSEELSKGRQLCSAKMATKIHESILKKVIPQLHHILVQKVVTCYREYGLKIL